MRNKTIGRKYTKKLHINTRKFKNLTNIITLTTIITTKITLTLTTITTITRESKRTQPKNHPTRNRKRITNKSR